MVKLFLNLVLILLIIVYNCYGSNRTDQCDYFSRIEQFRYYISLKCPPMFDNMCLDPLFDPYEAFEYRCNGFVLPLDQKSPVVAPYGSLDKILAQNDEFNRNWCLLTLFYSPECKFSNRVLPMFKNVLPKHFSKLGLVIVDASKGGGLNFRYGISGTPTIILWFNGRPVARMNSSNLTVSYMKDFIVKYTDLYADQRMNENQIETSNDDEISKLRESIEPINNNIHIITKLKRFFKSSDGYAITCFSVLLMVITYFLRKLVFCNNFVSSKIVNAYGVEAYQMLLFYLFIENVVVNNPDAIEVQIDGPEMEEFQVDNNVENRNDRDLLIVDDFPRVE